MAARSVGYPSIVMSTETTPSSDATAALDVEALRANLRLTPAQRIAELDRMLRFHHRVQVRTLSPDLRERLWQEEVTEARRRMEASGDGE